MEQVSNGCPYAVAVLCFKQKTPYEMRISDWSSDVCSTDLHGDRARVAHGKAFAGDAAEIALAGDRAIEHGVADDDRLRRHDARLRRREIGRASCRERVCQYTEPPVVPVSLKKNE